MGVPFSLCVTQLYQMVGLYKDPKGESVTTFPSSAQREGTETNATNRKKDTELDRLRRRVSELENSLSHKQVSYKLFLAITRMCPLYNICW